jgi:hypothetical protein
LARSRTVSKRRSPSGSPRRRPSPRVSAPTAGAFVDCTDARQSPSTPPAGLTRTRHGAATKSPRFSAFISSEHR